MRKEIGEQRFFNDKGLNLVLTQPLFHIFPLIFQLHRATVFFMQNAKCEVRVSHTVDKSKIMMYN